MNFDGDFLKGKTILITGGGTGIGRELSLAFAKRGASLIIASRNMENLRHTAREAQKFGAEVLATTVDVRNFDSIQKMVEESVQRFGKIDILINNAGANFLCPALQITPNGWRSVVDTVLTGTFFCSQAVARVMIQNGGGKIVNNAGSNGLNGSPLMVHSGAAKAGIINMTQTLAVEWAPFKIVVNAVAPGPIRTVGADSRLWPDEEKIQELSRQIPLQRFGTPHDVVGPILFLLSPAADYMTGSVITIDGGDVCRHLPQDLFKFFGKT